MHDPIEGCSSSLFSPLSFSGLLFRRRDEMTARELALIISNPREFGDSSLRTRTGQRRIVMRDGNGIASIARVLSDFFFSFFSYANRNLYFFVSPNRPLPLFPRRVRCSVTDERRQSLLHWRVSGGRKGQIIKKKKRN